MARRRVAERWHGWRWLCHIQGMDMDTEVDLTTVDRDVLIAIIAELQAVIERLQRRIAELEGQAKPGDPLRMPGLKAKSGRKPPAQQGPRKQRRHGFARPRMTPTHRVEHVMENCPDCGAHLSGGWIQRSREVIELPVVPVQIAEQVYIARTCPACRRRCTPPAELDGVVLGPPRQPSGPRRRNRLASARGQRLRVDFQHPHRTLLPAAGSGQNSRGRGAERCFLRSIGQRFLRRLPPL